MVDHPFNFQYRHVCLTDPLCCGNTASSGPFATIRSLGRFYTFVVIGGGTAGLAVAHRLWRASGDVLYDSVFKKQMMHHQFWTDGINLGVRSILFE